MLTCPRRAAPRRPHLHAPPRWPPSRPPWSPSPPPAGPTPVVAGQATVAGAPKVTVSLTDDGCAPSPATVPAGPTNFEMRNAGAGAVTEAEVMQGDRSSARRRTSPRACPAPSACG